MLLKHPADETGHEVLAVDDKPKEQAPQHKECERHVKDEENDSDKVVHFGLLLFLTVQSNIIIRKQGVKSFILV